MRKARAVGRVWAELSRIIGSDRVERHFPDALAEVEHVRAWGRSRAKTSIRCAIEIAAARASVGFEGFFRHYRRATTEAHLDGTTLPAGARIVLVWPAANRDDAAYQRPDEVQLDRANPRYHLGFGWGIHHCLGAPLARAESQIVFGLLRERFRLPELLDPDPPVAAGFLRGRRSLRVRLTPR